MRNENDSFDLQRFIAAQKGVYENVLSELRNGRKRSHWMWFIFPQFSGLGKSSTSEFYAIKSLSESWAYLCHPVLGARLRECTETVLGIDGHTALEIFGRPDDLKLRSCMTLFAAVDSADSIFERLLKKYFEGQHDPRTLRLIERF